MTVDHLTLHDFMPDGVGQATTEGYIARSGEPFSNLDEAKKFLLVMLSMPYQQSLILKFLLTSMS